MHCSNLQIKCSGPLRLKIRCWRCFRTCIRRPHWSHFEFSTSRTTSVHAKPVGQRRAIITASLQEHSEAIAYPGLFATPTAIPPFKRVIVIPRVIDVATGKTLRQLKGDGVVGLEKVAFSSD